jgi:hypothetical protein
MGYTRIYDREMTRLAESGLSASAVLVYMALCKYDHENTGVVYPNIATLESDLGHKYHRSSIEKSLKKLDDCGLLKRNHKRSKKRFVLVVRKAAFLQFAMDDLARKNEQKSYSQAPSDVTEPTRNMLRENITKENILYLYKPELEQLDEMIKTHNIGTWPSKFLLGIKKKSAKGKPLKGAQIIKYHELRKKYESTGYSQAKIEEGGNGSQIENETNYPEQFETDSHPELNAPTWGDPQWISKKKNTAF